MVEDNIRVMNDLDIQIRDLEEEIKKANKWKNEIDYTKKTFNPSTTWCIIK